ncbi:MAG: hypothetical protein M3379_12315, partial [Acidobacteriota bacterium]|nr:hypothetical protein [Acidobacteriota bacterium]
MTKPQVPARFVRLAAVALAYLCAFGTPAPVAWSAGQSRQSSSPRRSMRASAALLQSGDVSSVRQFPLLAKDLVVDPNTQTLYASLPSSAGANGNSIAAINPTTGAVNTNVFIGSEPGRMALSDDAQFIYVGLDGAASIRRFDVATQTAGPQFALGSDNFSGPFFPRDLTVQPGSPHTLAVSRSPSNGGTGAVAVYDDGTQRTGALSSFDNPSLAFDKTDSSRLYALGSGSLRRLSVTASGVSLSSTSSVSASGSIKFDDGRLYAASGQVFDPATASLIGTFTGTNINSSTPFLPDSKVKRVYFLTAPFSSPGSSTTLTLRVFDQQTFVPTGTLDIPGVFGSPSGLVRWGANGLAFCTTGGQLFLIQTTLVPSNETVPQPSPTPTTTPTPVPTPPVLPAFARRLALPAKDIVYDAGTQRIYASVSSSAGANGNSLTPVNPSDGTSGTPVFVGSEPNKLAISDNGQFIYVGLDGAASVRRFDIASQTAGIQFPLGSGFSTGPFYVEDMEVLPGNANAVAVARRNVGFSPKHEGVAVYDDGVQRPTTTPSHTGSNSIEFSASASTLYGFNNETTEFGFRKMAVDASGVTVTRVTGGIVSSFGNNIEFDAGRVYFSTGRVIEPESATILGTFPNIGFGNIVLPDSSVGRTFFISGTDLSDQSFNSTVTIRAFDQRTFLPVGSATVAGVNGRVLSFIRWGANGLAFCTSGGQLFLVQTALVPSAEAVPSPTPTASPTPVPSPSPAPTPAPGELRQLSLATNDLVVDPNTQTLYASLPSSAGAIGNSIAAIDPAAGVLGQAVFVGSEPNKLAISDNGQFIYVGLDGAASIRRFDVATKTAGLQFGLGSLPFGGGSLTARDISVAPGQPGTVAVVRRSGTSSGGVAVYDDGAPRTATESQSTTIEFSASPLVLYGFNGDSTEFGFRKLAVGPCGLTTVATTANLMSGFSADFKVDNATAYSSSGRAFDPEAARIAGTFALVSSNSFLSTTPLVAPDAKAGRVYFLLNDGGFVLRVYDIKTFLKIGELRLPGVTGTASSLVRWGANGLAFRTSGGQLFLLQHALVGGTDPSFTPASTPAPPTFT